MRNSSFTRSMACGVYQSSSRVASLSLGGRPGGVVRRGDYKLIEFYEDSHLELYKLTEDIGEQTNLLQKEPSLAREMHALLTQWRHTVDARMPSPNPAYQPD